MVAPQEECRQGEIRGEMGRLGNTRFSVYAVLTSITKILRVDDMQRLNKSLVSTFL
jgi:hypothetical protein